MRKFNSILILSLFTIVLFSCQKEVDDIFANNNTGNNNTVNNYLPLTAGSYWKYKDSATGNFSTMTATSQTKVIDNKTFNVVLGVTGSQTDTLYMTVAGSDYFQNLSGSSPGGAGFDILFHYLNDTAPAGTSWEYNAGQGNGFAAYIETFIVAKGLTMNIEGKTYSDVIHSRMYLSYDVMGMVIEAGFYDYYSAKNVGLVKIRAEVGSAGNTVITCLNLTEHHIQ